MVAWRNYLIVKVHESTLHVWKLQVACYEYEYGYAVLNKLGNELITSL